MADETERRKAEIISVIKDYIMQHGYPPTCREIGALVGLKSTSSVQHYLDQLFMEGKLETDAGPGAPRAIRIPGSKLIFKEEQ